MRRMRHLPIREQAINLNRVLRGHYIYYGIGANFCSLQKVYRGVMRYWRKMLSSRSRKGKIRWELFQKIQTRWRLRQPRLELLHRDLLALAVL